ncbi:dTDP-4-dehydrorhamnose reductase [Desulfopila sp. IMCC35006]|uniref:dTDP-4-dehydrorhamnose reductase n=1 Tax=Desulfopila sp. IMCC35006 TaxID=2569542 RepID=UPI0010AC5D13|nr:dTDP-4-dehydrorhamnose reductase [Desulfopila sp. IMCC35006]TKB26108.1 dTDP-4-dehydrorhamnose reductase [Desulfopila sp. IMCC35006]
MKILLLGKDGQLGWELQRSLAPLGEVTACGRNEADLTKLTELRALVRATSPQIIVNAAAYTAVDQAESEPEQAFLINSEAVDLLAQEACLLNSWLIHYSTDYVFDGTENGAYVETDTPAPLGVYGQSKLSGEEAVRASGCQHLILRTSWVYAARGNNFIKTMLRLASERDELKVVCDQIGAPTSAELLADVTAYCLYRLQYDASFSIEKSGTYHLTASGITSWHGFARLILEEAFEHGVELRATAKNVLAIPTSDYPLPAKRPANSQLTTEKIRNTFNLELPPWQLHAKRALAEIVSCNGLTQKKFP